ncbi:MAG: signal peptide peptidase SppA [Legionellales bacterium RIFCSPHIGHO2_12_FULL_35_11]|nr:MAG: signal peptide peptidase SppA [Legionellales bacterium RIFCSPHIGHO2_12_FULL_35_11]
MNQSTITDSQNSQELLNQIIFEHFNEQKRKRKSRLFRRIIYTVIFLILLGILSFNHMEDTTIKFKPHVGLIDIKGEILDSQFSSSDSLMKSLANAYHNKGLQAVILRIDSPGGSPVQADYMYNALKYFMKKYPNIKTYAVCVDSCASAAYYVASAADEIYANPTSMVGSIGVVYNGFGFVDLINKLGISRRLITSGQNKGFMDQFSPVNPNQEKDLQDMLNLIHQQFINQVKAGRGSRLKIDPNTFSGLIWTGEQAKQMGLIDGFASSGQLVRDVIKIDSVVDYTEKTSVLDQFADKLGSSMLGQLPKSLNMKQGFQEIYG